MQLIKRVDENGWAWVVGVPDDATVELYEYGAYLGPPDLTSLPITEEQMKQLRHKLVEAGLFAAPQLMGQRKFLLNLLEELEISKENMRQLLFVFQQAYYGEI